MRLFVLGNELKVVKIVFFEARVGKILLGEFLQRLFVEDILEMFKLRKSALHAEQLRSWVVNLQLGRTEGLPGPSLPVPLMSMGRRKPSQ